MFVKQVLDNLNTHFTASFDETFGQEQAKSILQRIEFHYTPKHASWLNGAKIEFNVMNIECTNRRFEDLESLEQEVRVWTRRRNRDKKNRVPKHTSDHDIHYFPP